MEQFDCVFDALKEVKRLSSGMRKHSEIYFAYNTYYERYFVTDDSDELSKKIHKRWLDSACESKPQDEASEYKIWEYSLAENKEKYPNTYRDAKKSLIKSEAPLIRRSKEVEVEYSVDFVIGY